MEKNGTGSRAVFWAAWRSCLILPVDVVAGLPRLELIGNRQLYLERHTGLLAYSDTQIDANTGFGVLRIRGERLTLVAMTGEELRIGGKINGVEWVSC